MNQSSTQKIGLECLEKAIKESWSQETLGKSSFDPENPAWGQCLITVLVVQDYLGGEIESVTAKLSTNAAFIHYINKVNGATIDIAGCQFPEGTEYEPVLINGLPASRGQLLRDKSTTKRYELLKRLVKEKLN